MPTFLLIGIVFLLLQNHSLHSSNQPKTELPSMRTDEASQWLNLPPRWRQQHRPDSSSSTNEIDRLVKQLQLLNDNGIPQTDIQSIEGLSMEVFYEVSRLGRRAS